MSPTYELIRTARWLGVAPWELARQPVYWRRWTELAIAAENVIAETAAGKR